MIQNQAKSPERRSSEDHADSAVSQHLDQRLTEAAQRHNFLRLESLAHHRELELAIQKLWSRDDLLLSRGANERSICHRLAIYLEQAYNSGFPENCQWHVDCEYNILKGPLLEHQTLNSEGMKKHLRLRDADEEHRVYPDIVVHKRDTEENRLVIEVKVFREGRFDKRVCADFAKLKGFTDPEGFFKYEHGILLAIFAGNGQPGTAQFAACETPSTHDDSAHE